ncbi:hypothetical protein BuS5_00910 [Desulfosarcina sp. BuS5]|uniref:hypothetical protein n=2 Tax=Desulfosarcina sp. BuS5 TaxID=933262 RepID=UPI00237860EA|nr:hypothetical protein [Desulfosarcina sp. BuS5]WDN87942.1 hypothetical protein BuS5_00910 [Desulfosarcina sp. BuS5]
MEQIDIHNLYSEGGGPNPEQANYGDLDTPPLNHGDLMIPPIIISGIKYQKTWNIWLIIGEISMINFFFVLLRHGFGT